MTSEQILIIVPGALRLTGDLLGFGSNISTWSFRIQPWKVKSTFSVSILEWYIPFPYTFYWLQASYTTYYYLFYLIWVLSSQNGYWPEHQTGILQPLVVPDYYPLVAELWGNLRVLEETLGGWGGRSGQNLGPKSNVHLITQKEALQYFNNQFS